MRIQVTHKGKDGIPAKYYAWQEVERRVFEAESQGAYRMIIHVTKEEYANLMECYENCGSLSSGLDLSRPGGGPPILSCLAHPIIEGKK
jgi:hypothetical protein